MKELKLILLLQVSILGASTLYADEECPCDGGTAAYSFDCDDDGTMDACSADDCEAPSVSITSGGGDIRKRSLLSPCSMDWDCSPSGGSGQYTYSWSPSTGSGSWTTQSFTSHPNAVGEGTMTVTVTDSVSGQTATDSATYHIHEKIEAEETSSDTGYDGPYQAVSNSQTCPADSPGNCNITFTTTSTHSLSVGITVTSGVDAAGVKTEVSGTTTDTYSTSTGESHQFPVAPGATRRVGVRGQIKTREGTCSEYDCSGLAASGTWTDISADPSPTTCFDYGLIAPF